ncbi:MAG: hypothetical protein Kow0092_37690 [Deferrisomatales bacterium]
MRLLPRPNKQMEVVRQQRPETGAGTPPVLVVAEDHGPFDPAGPHVLYDVEGVQSGGAWHGRHDIGGSGRAKKIRNINSVPKLATPFEYDGKPEAGSSGQRWL